MPVTTPFVKVEATQAHGAEVVLEGETRGRGADRAPRRIARERGLTFVHPYDDPLRDRRAGHHRARNAGGRARSRHAGDPDRRRRADRRQRDRGARASSPSIEIVGAEAALYPSFWNALHGANIARSAAPTLAEGIAVKNVGKLTLPIVRELVAEIVLVDEAQLERAVNAYLTLQKTMAEGAGAAGLAAMLAEPERFRGRKVGLILCGGNIDPRILASIMVRELERDDRIVSFRLTIPDRPGVLGPDRHPARAARRQYSRGRPPAGCSSTCRRKAPSSTSRSRRATAPTARRFCGRSRPRATSRCGSRPRPGDGVEPEQARRVLPLQAFALHDLTSAANHPWLGGRALREKELRIALVCFGGVSLAVYMHGISKEILKLVRASSALHAIADRSRAHERLVLRSRRPQRSGIRHRAVLFRAAARDRAQRRVARDRRHHRRRLGRRHQRHHAGACASHDLPMDALRDLWLDNADVTVLLSPDARAGAWSKWFLKPFSGPRRRPAASARSRTWRCARSSRCSCARAGSSRRSTAASWPV